MGQSALARVLRESQGANPKSNAADQIAKVADFCAAQWQVFTPPLTR